MANLTVLAEFEHEYVVAKHGADGRRKIGKLYCPSCNNDQSMLVRQDLLYTAIRASTSAALAPLSQTPVAVQTTVWND